MDCPDEDGIRGGLHRVRLHFSPVFVQVFCLLITPRRISPQCSPSGISHLLGASSSTHLIYHSMYAELARSAKELNPTIPLVELPALPAYQMDKSDSVAQSMLDATELVQPEMVSHVFHTSGTSGTPKPIPQTHIATVSVLPRRALPSYLSTSSLNGDEVPTVPPEPAAFTTTPLFHGGVSDLLRAWMARSMIYFFPTSSTPITSHNVVQAVEICRHSPLSLLELELSQLQLEERRKRFWVAAILSVPYILTILSEDLDGSGIQMLKDMELVSTGGAPLDTGRGDRMVERSVKLVSRLGSSECGCEPEPYACTNSAKSTFGFAWICTTVLLSSHRDYETEKDWEWLRNDSAYSDALMFEPVDTGGRSGQETFEMIVADKWSSKVSKLRSGPYLSDESHPLASRPKPIGMMEAMRPVTCIRGIQRRRMFGDTLGKETISS